MDRGESPLFTGTEIESVSSVVAEKNAFKVQDYEKRIASFKAYNVVTHLMMHKL